MNSAPTVYTSNAQEYTVIASHNAEKSKDWILQKANNNSIIATKATEITSNQLQGPKRTKNWVQNLLRNICGEKNRRSLVPVTDIMIITRNKQQ